MNRKYPFDIISDNDTVTISQAKSLVLKYLKQNNCVANYVDCWKHTQKRLSKYHGEDITIDEIIEFGVKYLKGNIWTLNSLFTCIGASFDWLYAKCELGFDTNYWKSISDKWRKNLGGEVYIID